MTRLFQYVFAISGLLVVVGLTFRLIWHTSGTETGFETLRLQWTDATWGWVVGNHRPIRSFEPLSDSTSRANKSFDKSKQSKDTRCVSEGGGAACCRRNTR